MENEVLFEISDNYFEKLNTGPREWNFFSFAYGIYIPIKKLLNAYNTYAPYDLEMERPLILVDDTLFRSAKIGVLLTNTRLFYRLIDKVGGTCKKNSLPLNEINQLYIDLYKRGSNLVINGKKVGIMRAFGMDDFKKRDAKILNNLFDLYLNALHSKREEEDPNDR
jgi:hypothetical protein